MLHSDHDFMWRLYSQRNLAMTVLGNSSWFARVIILFELFGNVVFDLLELGFFGRTYEIYNDCFFQLLDEERNPNIKELELAGKSFG